MKLVPQKSSYHKATAHVVANVIDVTRNVVKENRFHLSERQISILELMIMKPTI